MARLSQGLIQGMMNPSYANRLGDAVSGGFQGIDDAIQARQSRTAGQAAQAMLTGGDVNDPRVQQSVQSVYQQMNQDPDEAQALIKAAQVESRAGAQEERAKQAALEQRARHELMMGKEQEAEEMKKARAIAIGKVQAGADPSNVVQSMPPHLQEEAMSAITNQKAFEQKLQSYKEDAKGREPFSADTVKAIALTPGMEGPVAAYQKMVKDNPVAAKRVLLQNYTTAHTANVRGSTQSTKLPAGAVTRYQKYVDTLDFNQASRPQWMGGKGMSLGIGTGIPEDMKLALATKMAQAERDEPGFEPTPERAKAMLGELTKERIAEENTPPPQDVPVDTPAAKGEKEALQEMFRTNPKGMSVEQKARLRSLLSQ